MRRLPESFVGARAGAVPADSREQARPRAAEKPVVVQQEWPGRELLNSPMPFRHPKLSTPTTSSLGATSTSLTTTPSATAGGSAPT